MPSNNGSFKYNILRNVSKIERKDNLRIPEDDKLHNVLILHLPRMKYYMRHFPSIGKRDLAYDFITKNSSSVLLLDYNEYFCEEVITFKKCKELVSSKFELFAQLRSRISDLSKFRSLDAFRACKDLHNNIISGTPMPVHNTNLANLWAGTLSCPVFIRGLGLTPKQFWSVLISKNNEIFNNVTRTDDTV